MDKDLYNIKVETNNTNKNNSSKNGMELSEAIENLKFIIERYDHYYDGVNNKCSFYIGLNTFIFGGICFGYLSLYDKVQADFIMWVLFIGVVISNLISIVLTVLATTPFLKNSSDKTELPSLIFFGGVSKHNLTFFKEKYLKSEKVRVLDDLLQQAYCLACGLNGKYKKLKRASLLVLIQFTLLLPLFYLIIKNLKS